MCKGIEGPGKALPFLTFESGIKLYISEVHICQEIVGGRRIQAERVENAKAYGVHRAVAAPWGVT